MAFEGRSRPVKRFPVMCRILPISFSRSGDIWHRPAAPGSGDIDGEVVPSQDGFLYLLAHGNVQEASMAASSSDILSVGVILRFMIFILRYIVATVAAMIYVECISRMRL